MIKRSELLDRTLLPWLKANGIKTEAEYGGAIHTPAGEATNPTQIQWTAEGQSPHGENVQTLEGYINDEKWALLDGLLNNSLIPYLKEGRMVISFGAWMKEHPAQLPT